MRKTFNSIDNFTFLAQQFFSQNSNTTGIHIRENVFQEAEMATICLCFLRKVAGFHRFNVLNCNTSLISDNVTAKTDKAYTCKNLNEIGFGFFFVLLKLGEANLGSILHSQKTGNLVHFLGAAHKAQEIK